VVSSPSLRFRARWKSSALASSPVSLAISYRVSWPAGVPLVVAAWPSVVPATPRTVMVNAVQRSSAVTWFRQVCRFCGVAHSFESVVPTASS
jgi:hypothetical protein